MVPQEPGPPLPQISGQLSPRLFRKLPPRVCVSLKNIVDEDFLYAGHIFLGFSKCGRYVLSYTSSSGDDDFSFYIYHLYWWEFNVHSKLKLVGPGPGLGYPFQQRDQQITASPEPHSPCL